MAVSGCSVFQEGSSPKFLHAVFSDPAYIFSCHPLGGHGAIQALSPKDLPGWAFLLSQGDRAGESPRHWGRYLHSGVRARERQLL